MIGQLIELGAAMRRQQRRVILDRAVRRDVEEVPRHEQRHEGHDLKVGLERLELLPHLRLAVGFRLMHRKARGERRLLQRVGLLRRLLGRHIDGDDVLAALQQRIENRLAEGLLAVNDDAHSSTPCF